MVVRKAAWLAAMMVGELAAMMGATSASARVGPLDTITVGARAGLTAGLMAGASVVLSVALKAANSDDQWAESRAVSRAALMACSQAAMLAVARAAMLAGRSVDVWAVMWVEQMVANLVDLSVTLGGRSAEPLGLHSCEWGMRKAGSKAEPSAVCSVD